jgi:probable rRNA maturation factor
MPEAGLVEVIVEEARWEGVGIGRLAEAAARAAIVAAGRDPDRHEVALLACGDARIAALNAEYRGKAGATNVLSWPAFAGAPPGPGRLFLGDIALAFETCAREAAEGGIPLATHAAHLIVHGVLHLLGHRHEDAREAEAMEALETKALASMGLPNPYSA